VQQCHNPLHIKGKYNNKISQTKHPQRNCKEMVIISWSMRNVYITSIIWSRNFYLREHLICWLLCFTTIFPQIRIHPVFEWGVRFAHSSIFCVVFHRPLFDFSPFFCWSLYCLSFLGLRLLIIIFGLFKLFLYHPPIYNNIVILLYTNMAYVKRQYDIKQSIGNGIRIKLSPHPSKVITTCRGKSWIATTVDTHK